MEQVQERTAEQEAYDAASPNGEAPTPEEEARDIQVTLGTPQIDSFMQILEEVIDPLSEEISQLENPTNVDMAALVVRVIRRNAYPRLVGWMAEAAGIPEEELNSSVMLQAKALRALREQGLGDFLGEAAMLLGPVLGR